LNAKTHREIGRVNGFLFSDLGRTRKRSGSLASGEPAEIEVKIWLSRQTPKKPEVPEQKSRPKRAPEKVPVTSGPERERERPGEEKGTREKGLTSYQEELPER